MNRSLAILSVVALAGCATPSWNSAGTGSPLPEEGARGGTMSPTPYRDSPSASSPVSRPISVHDDRPDIWGLIRRACAMVDALRRGESIDPSELAELLNQALRLAAHEDANDE